MNRLNRCIFTVVSACTVAVMTGCQAPEPWSYTGPRVYLIEGEPSEQSEGLVTIRQMLAEQEINARVYYPEEWLEIVADIDADPDEEVILVGHGHGAFLATQIVRHYAQRHKTKFIDAVFTLDAYNKDWPHNRQECGRCDPHLRPAPIPIGHNAIKVRNYNQSHPDSRRWGSDLVSARGSDVAMEHPYYWYDDFWTGQHVAGQHLSSEVNHPDVLHTTIDNHDELVQRIILMCRKAALTPFHYTPPEHHPDVKKKDQPIRPGATRKTTASANPRMY